VKAQPGLEATRRWRAQPLPIVSRSGDDGLPLLASCASAPPARDL